MTETLQKTENVVNENSQDLTEQWKKGKLPEGAYYVRCDWSDDVEIRYVHNGVDDWAEIVAPVPSYEEYNKLWQANKEVANRNIDLIIKLNILKDLLKECRNILKEQNFYRNTPVETDTTYRTRCLRKQELLTKIDEVLNA